MASQFDPLIGREIDGYLIERLLGKGGMARVYRAQDVRLGRYAAIKVIVPEARSAEDYIRRFEKEARAVAQLQHPHIVSIYRFGEVGGLLYMAMQYIDGTDLGWVLLDYAQDNQLMSHDEILHVVTQIASALDYAHSKGVIHRDIKPSNVMLDKEGRAIVTDFGLALMQKEGTQGEIFGTPHYVAPEQAVSSAGAVPQSDQYALGVMLYEMLTGGVPFDGKSPMDIALAHMTEPLPPPLERNPDLHPALVAVLEKVLEKEPENRYSSCGALVADLESAMRGQQQKPSTISRLSALRVSEQVEAFRAANPLPPLPAAVMLPPQSAVQVVPSPTTQQATPAITLKHPSNQRQIWGLVGIASAIILIAGFIGVIALFANNNNNNQSIAVTVPIIVDSPTTAAPLTATTSVGAVVTSPVETAAATQVIILSTITLPPATPTSAPITPAAVMPATLATNTYVFNILTRGKDSLFITNVSAVPLPLHTLRIGDGSSAINGSDWGIETLENGQCVTAWKDSGKPEPPDTSCIQVGERITRDGRNRFWKDSFSVYYNGIQVGVCSSEQCTVTIIG